MIEQQNPQLSQKQIFLRLQIIQSGINGQSFMQFMGQYKNQGLQIDLDNWSMKQLQQVVTIYKHMIDDETHRQSQIQQVLSSIDDYHMNNNHYKNSYFNKLEECQDTSSMSNGNDSRQIKKIFYKNDQKLYDQEMLIEVKCHKQIPKFSLNCQDVLKVKPQRWQIRSIGGYLFGIGSTYELFVQISSNFLNQKKVERKSSDFDWLRKALCKKYPGVYIPFLNEGKYLQPENTKQVKKRVQQIINFINECGRYQTLLHSKLFYDFLNQSNHQKFSQMRAHQENSVKQVKDIGLVQNLEGKCKPQISQSFQKFKKNGIEYFKDSKVLLKNIEEITSKVLKNIDDLSINLVSLSTFCDKFKIKAKQMSFNSQSQELLNISEYIESFSQLFKSISTQRRQQMTVLRDQWETFIKRKDQQYTQFINFHKQSQKNLNEYFQFKQKMQKTKQKAWSQFNKWIHSKQNASNLKINGLNQMMIYEKQKRYSKQDAIKIMIPDQIRKEKEAKLWQSYLNCMYRQSFNNFVKNEKLQFQTINNKIKKRIIINSKIN